MRLAMSDRRVGWEGLAEAIMEQAAIDLRRRKRDRKGPSAESRRQAAELCADVLTGAGLGERVKDLAS